jgi:hypothetical protein
VTEANEVTEEAEYIETSDLLEVVRISVSPSFSWDDEDVSMERGRSRSRD